MTLYDAESIVALMADDPSGFSPVKIGQQVKIRLRGADYDELEAICNRGGLDLELVQVMEFSSGEVDYVTVFRKVRRAASVRHRS